jgi:hypothetical protein
MDGSAGYPTSDDDTHKKAEGCLQWFREAQVAANKFGKPADHAPLWKEKMEKAGFVEVREFIFQVCLPCNCPPFVFRLYHVTFTALSSIISPVTSSTYSDPL